MDDRFDKDRFIGADIALNEAVLNVATSMVGGLLVGGVLGALFTRSPARVARFTGGFAVGLTISKESLVFQENKAQILSAARLESARKRETKKIEIKETQVGILRA
jgi:hypothetical protein